MSESITARRIVLAMLLLTLLVGVGFWFALPGPNASEAVSETSVVAVKTADRAALSEPVPALGTGLEEPAEALAHQEAEPDAGEVDQAALIRILQQRGGDRWALVIEKLEAGLLDPQFIFKKHNARAERNLLFVAMPTADDDELRAMIRLGVPVYPEHLVSAASRSSPEIFNELLAYGLSPYAADGGIEAALQSAAMSGHPQSYFKLLEMSGDDLSGLRASPRASWVVSRAMQFGQSDAVIKSLLDGGMPLDRAGLLASGLEPQLQEAIDEQLLRIGYPPVFTGGEGIGME